jgi:uncharacterized surface protein with fasciclin (FAS1) repeats
MYAGVPTTSRIPVRVVLEGDTAKADSVATNGIVHAIDEVILPKNWQLLAAAA